MDAHGAGAIGYADDDSRIGAGWVGGFGTASVRSPNRREILSTFLVRVGVVTGVELTILTLLAHHQTLAYTQIAAVLQNRPYGIEDALATLREHGLVEIADADKAEARTSPFARWQLTDAGREELAQWGLHADGVENESTAA